MFDALDYILGTLDKPGRATRGLLGGNAREGLGFIPFSDTLGLTDKSEAVSGRDLLTAHGIKTGSDFGDSILGFGAELALDPTTYLGGFAGRLGGKAIGRGLETAARARGPGYATSADDVMSMLNRGVNNNPDHAYQAMHLLDQYAPSGPGPFREIPPGSEFLGAGGEAFALKTPAGDVVRVGTGNPGEAGRPMADSLLPATRTVQFPPAPGADDAIRVERSPLAADVGDSAKWSKPLFAEMMSPASSPDEMQRIMAAMSPQDLASAGKTRIGALKDTARSQGLDFWDTHSGNVGTYHGRPVVIDPGAVTPLPDFAGGFQSVTTPGQPGDLSSLLLDLLGGRRAMQRALDAGRSAPAYERNLGYAGLFAGGSLGAT